MKNINKLNKELKMLRENKGKLRGSARAITFRYLEGQKDALKDVLELIDEERWLEEDERHSERFRDGIKLAHKILKQKLYEVIEMDELKRQTMEILKLLEQDMVERIKEAEKSGEGIDLMSRNAKVMECLAKLDTAHTEAKLRTSNKKSGWFK